MEARFKGKSVLSGMRVAEAMQRAFSWMRPDRGLDSVIRQMIRAKENVVLVANQHGQGMGLVSKSDVMAAFYGGLPLGTACGDIMAGPLVTCLPDMGLDQAVDIMKDQDINQIFVADQDSCITGRISFEDIAGLIYRICRACKKGLRRHRDSLPRLVVREVMTGRVTTCQEQDTLVRVMDLLSSQKIRAVPVTDDFGRTCGVISKTDLVLAYLRGMSVENPARSVMSGPVVSGTPDQLLSKALETMLMTDVQHLFVTMPENGSICGVVSLSDAVRFRSGTCRACSSSRNF